MEVTSKSDKRKSSESPKGNSSKKSQPNREGIVMSNPEETKSYFERILSELKDVKEQNTRLQEQNDKLQEMLQQQQGVIDELKAELNEVRQERLDRSFILLGMPPVKADAAETLSILKRFLRVSNVDDEIKAEDFERLYIMTTRNNKGAIMMGEFWDRRKRMIIMNKVRHNVREKGHVWNEKVFEACKRDDSSFKGKPIWMRSQLTQETRQLMDQARQHKTILPYVWERDGRVLVKPHKKGTEDPKTYRIRSGKQLGEVLRLLREE